MCPQMQMSELHPLWLLNSTSTYPANLPMGSLEGPPVEPTITDVGETDGQGAESMKYTLEV